MRLECHILMERDCLCGIFALYRADVCKVSFLRIVLESPLNLVPTVKNKLVVPIPPLVLAGAD